MFLLLANRALNMAVDPLFTLTQGQWKRQERVNDAEGPGSRAGSEHEDDDEAFSQRSGSRKVCEHAGARA